jgi:adenylate cyclase
LFADLRGYTSLSQSLAPDAISRVLDVFYDESASAIWEYDGLLNKTIGDAVMAVFNFPIKRVDYARHAVLAAREIQRRWHAKREMLGEAPGASTAVNLGLALASIRESSASGSSVGRIVI